jgi:hypothetical protein
MHCCDCAAQLCSEHPFRNRDANQTQLELEDPPSKFQRSETRNAAERKLREEGVLSERDENQEVPSPNQDWRQVVLPQEVAHVDIANYGRA